MDGAHHPDESPKPIPTPTPKPIPTEKQFFNVEVLRNAAGEKVYKCPICNSTTGTSAPKFPNDTSLFAHKRSDCPNINKIPREP